MTLARKVTDEQIIQALLECDTQQASAKKLGITPQTIVNRMKNAEFIAKYNNAQNEILRGTTRKLSNASGKSADLLIKTMNDKNVNLLVRISIAKDILRLGRDFVCIDELQRRISEIEYNAMLKEQESTQDDEPERQYKMFNVSN
jgi:predicted transcriptional regulator